MMYVAVVFGGKSQRPREDWACFVNKQPQTYELHKITEEEISWS